MFNFAINNETIQGGVPVSSLTNQPPFTEVGIMAENQHTTKEIRQSRRIPINPGDRFGRLTVIKEIERKIFACGHSIRKFMCLCDCGKITTPSICELRNGTTRSCGCRQRDSVTKHGLAKHPLYDIYFGMKYRCYNEKHTSFESYGARGIGVCDEWRNDYKAFYDWCISNGWKKELLLDRRNNDEGYSPDNCRLVDAGLSARNTRTLAKNNTSGYRGVCLSKLTHKWIAKIQSNNTGYHIGSFDTPEEAAKAYDAKARELNAGHPLNFP